MHAIAFFSSRAAGLARSRVRHPGRPLVCPVRPDLAICLNKRSSVLSEVLVPATPAPFVDPCAVGDSGSDGASYAAALADALRKKRGSDVPDEITEAQDSLERRIRAHL